MIVTCGKCSRKYRIPDAKVGGQFTCRHCGHVIRTGLSSRQPTPMPAGHVPVDREISTIFETEADEASKIHCLISSRGPFVLTQDKRFLIGREKGCDLIVDDARVSRQHAELFWDNTAFLLRDLKSRNGLFVNGEPAMSTHLIDRDRIEVSGYPFVYRKVNAMKDLRESVRMYRTRSAKEETSEIKSLNASSKERELSGTLGTLTVPEICQLLQFGHRTGRLTIFDPDKQKAELYFLHGNIVAGQYGEKSGDDAVMTIFRMTEGIFGFRAGEKTSEENVKTPTPHLLLEAARLMDEAV